jgi:hypothetical protein
VNSSVESAASAAAREVIFIFTVTVMGMVGD